LGFTEWYGGRVMGSIKDKWFSEIDMLNSFMKNPTKKRLQFKEYLVKQGVASPDCITHEPIKDIQAYWKQKYPRTQDTPYNQYYSKKVNG
jgi:hypothetical protein